MSGGPRAPPESRGAEAPTTAADADSEPHLVDHPAARVTALGGRGDHRQTGDRRPVASRRLSPLLAVAIPVPRGRPSITEEMQTLIRVATENPTWGAPRIHGELLNSGSRSPKAASRATCAASHGAVIPRRAGRPFCARRRRPAR
jgi:hypothetical protein